MDSKRAAFKRLAEARVEKLIKQIKLVGNLSNKNNYEYTDDDVRKIFDVVSKELGIAKARFQSEQGSNAQRKFTLD